MSGLSFSRSAWEKKGTFWHISQLNKVRLYNLGKFYVKTKLQVKNHRLIISKIPDVGGQISKVIDSLIFKEVTGQVL